MFLHTEAIFFYYSVNNPDLLVRKYIVALIPSSLTVVLCTWIFINSCETLSSALTHVINKQRLNNLIFDVPCVLTILLVKVGKFGIIYAMRFRLLHYDFGAKVVSFSVTFRTLMPWFYLYINN